MALFGPDPKDEIIQVLKDERDYLRRKIEEMEKQFLALTSTHAYRLVHGEEPPGPPAKPSPPDPFTLRATDYEPRFSLAEVEGRFRAPKD